MKIREANGFDLKLLVFIGGPISLIGSVVFRLLHNCSNKWSMFHEDEQASCLAPCPPLPYSTYKELVLPEEAQVEDNNENSVSAIVTLMEDISEGSNGSEEEGDQVQDEEENIEMLKEALRQAQRKAPPICFPYNIVVVVVVLP